MDPQLDFYRAKVKEQTVQSFAGEFAEVDLRPSTEIGLEVDLNSTALHYPLDIFDRGEYAPGPIGVSRHLGR